MWRATAHRHFRRYSILLALYRFRPAYPKTYVVVEKTALVKSQVSGCLETKGFADFDILVAWGLDAFEIDSGMVLVFDPQA